MTSSYRKRALVCGTGGFIGHHNRDISKLKETNRVMRFCSFRILQILISEVKIEYKLRI